MPRFTAARPYTTEQILEPLEEVILSIKIQIGLNTIIVKNG